MMLQIPISWNWERTTIQRIMQNLPYTNSQKNHHWNEYIYIDIYELKGQ